MRKPVGLFLVAQDAHLNTLEQLHSGALQGTQRLTLRAGLRELPEALYTLADTPIFSCVRLQPLEMLDRLG